MNPYTENVKRGAVLLDQERPGWRDEIDLATLDLSDGCSCILGQVFGYYSDGVWALFEVDLSDDDCFAEAFEETEDLRIVVSHGFTIDRPLRSYKWHLLQEAWRAELEGPASQQREPLHMGSGSDPDTDQTRANDIATSYTLKGHIDPCIGFE
jgi:hypothetical protein